MKRPALLFFGLLLVACEVPALPQPAPVELHITRLDAHHVRATLDPAQARARWSVRQDEECGAEDGPAIGGKWPPDGPLVVLAGMGDLLSATFSDQGTGAQMRVQDCVPAFGMTTTNAQRDKQ